MTDFIHWLSLPGPLGLPHWGLLFFIVGAFIEWALGRSSDPRFRSLAQAIASLVGIVLRPIVTRVPGLHTVMTKFLDFLAPALAGECPTCKRKLTTRSARKNSLPAPTSS